MSRGTGISHGAISVMNAIPCGIGSTIGIDLKTTAVFETADDIVITLKDRPGMSTLLTETCVRHARESIGEDTGKGYHLTVETDIPPSMGLKSSSSVCNAVISSVLNAYGKGMDEVEMIRLGVECAKECKVTVTGAFDDACGCQLGGLVLTDNRMNEIVHRMEIPEYDVIICIPDRTITKDKVPVDRYRELMAEYAFMASIIRKDYTFVMSENGKHVADIIGDDSGFAAKAMGLGAVAAGITGTGPATAILAKKGDGERIASAMGCRTIITTTR